jgi:hypothetical protein
MAKTHNKNEHSMSYTYLLAAGEESLAESFSDMSLSAPWKSTNTAEKSYCNGSAMESCRGFQSGMMSQPSTESRGEESWMSSVAASHAKTYPAPEKARESKVSEAVSGRKWSESFATLNQNGSSWRTHQCSLFEDLEESFVTWPPAGMMRNGVCWARETSVRLTNETESGSWATPQASDCRKVISTFGSTLRNRKNIPELGTVSGWINPELSEWLMGWPPKWTDCAPLEMDKFRLWLQRHSRN